MADEIPSPFQLKELSYLQLSQEDFIAFVQKAGGKAGFIALFDSVVPCEHQVTTGFCGKPHDIKVMAFGIKPEEVETVLRNLILSYRGAQKNGNIGKK